MIEKLRHTLPYGLAMQGTKQVLFNRDYKPIWERETAGKAQAADGIRRPGFDVLEYFYNDSNPPWRNKATRERCQKVLEEWGVPL